MIEMSLTDEEEASEVDSFVVDPDNLASAHDHTALASKLAFLAATTHTSMSDSNDDDQISVDAETQARLEALLEAAGIGKLSTSDGKAFADPEVLKRLSSSVSCALDEAAAALSKMKADAAENSNENIHERTLVEACSQGDVATVRRLLCAGWSPNETTEDGESLLSLACSAGYYELAEVLLTMHANVEDCGAKGDCTPIMEAASGGYADIVQLLIKHGADVNATSNTGNTALTYASCGGFEDVVRVLVDAGAELESHNENGHTPLMEAASGGHVTVAAILLDRGAGINTHSNEFKESALTLACYKGHLPMVKYLLKAGADQEHKTDEMHTALMEASMDGHVDVARLLLDSGAQVNMPADSFESPLTLAACGGHVELAELLIQRGAALEEVNDEGYTPLMEASREGHEEMVALLLAKGSNVNTKTEETQETALTLACCGGFLECAELLVGAGADIETGCSTPLMEAAQEGQLDLVKFLLQQGANVRSKTSSGDTALSYACEHGHTDVADILLAAGAELEHETECGRTPLMKAARAGHLCTVQFLISRGADVNKTTKNNEHSVLSLACVCGHVSVVELLLCQGADPTRKLKDGSTMLLEAAKGGHTAVVQLLLDFPHSFLAISPDSSQIASPRPDQLASRVPTQSLPMVVPPQEPDGSPDIHTADHFKEMAISEQPPVNSEQTKSPADDKTTTALVTHLIQQGSILSQATEYLSPDAKLAVDKDVAITVESFLRSMASDAVAGQARTTESIVEEAQGKLTELEQRIKEAIEKNAQLKSIEMMQTDQLTKEKVEELYKTREEQIYKKQKILEELQKVERELQLKTQQQLKKHYLDMKQKEVTQRGKPDGGDNVSSRAEGKATATTSATLTTPLSEMPETLVPAQPKPAVVKSAVLHDAQKMNNGASGSLSQAVKAEEDGSYCQCSRHPPSPPLPTAIEAGDLQYPPVAHDMASSAIQYQQLEIDGFTESNHDTPLTLACAGGHEELVQLLLSRGANIEHRDKKGFTPLILAATAGHVSVVAILLEENADLEAQSERTKDTPLSLACSGGRLEVVELLLNRGSNKEHRNVSDYTPLSLAASGGYVNIIKLLLNHGAEINSRTGSKLGISPLMLAAMNGHTQAVQLLLDMGADINAQIETNRNTALTLACFQGRHEVVSLLVDRKANVEHRAKTGLTPLMEAASGGYAEVGRVLLDKGADPNASPVPSSRDTALTIAADKGHYRFCELVLTRGAQVEVRNKKGNTSLWLACNGGHLDVVMLLVGKGADVNAADNRNVTPLMAAFRKGHVQVVRWLANEVSQFPSDAECMRYIATISDREILKRSHQCMECIVQAKDRQAEEANKFASELLEELDLEKTQEKTRKERLARKREKKKMKRKLKLTKKSEDDYKEDDIGGVDGDEVEVPLADVAKPSKVPSPYPIIPIATPSPSEAMTEQIADTLASVTTANSHVNERIIEKVKLSPMKRTVNHRLPATTLASEEQLISLDVVKSESVSCVSSTAVESSPRSQNASHPSRKTRKSQSSAHKQNSSARLEAAREISRGSTSISARTAASPGKRSARRDEAAGWKEVTRKYVNSNTSKRILVDSKLISRLIGRAGCNINAIREATGAHIDIDKQRKGSQERTVTIKGNAESTRYAYNLITSIIKEDGNDHDVQAIIARTQAPQASSSSAASSSARNITNKPTLTVIAAPIPAKPAWAVPPSIVAQTRSTAAPPTPWSVAVTVTTSTVSNITNDPAVTTSVSVVSKPSVEAASVEMVKKALFTSVTSTSTTAVTFTSKVGEKSTSKPVQPVAPMMSTKIMSTIPPLIRTTFNVATTQQSSNKHHLPSSSAAAITSVASSATSPPQIGLVDEAGARVEAADSSGGSSGANRQPQDVNRSVVMQTPPAAAHHMIAAQSGGHPASAHDISSSSSDPATTASSSSVSTVHPISPFNERKDAMEQHNLPAASDIEVAAQPPPLQQNYSHFRNSYTPPAGSSPLWSNGSKSEMNIAETTPTSPPLSQQGSPSNDPETVSKPRPIGTERAHHRRSTATMQQQPAAGTGGATTSQVGPTQPSNIWSYDKLEPTQIGISQLDQNKYSSWSADVASSQNDVSTTIVAVNTKPQLAPSQVEKKQEKAVGSDLNSAASSSTSNRHPYSQIAPISNPFHHSPTVAGLGTQPPIGSHLGSSSSVGVVGPQQHNPGLPPIGSHLGGAGHMRPNNNTYQHLQQQQQQQQALRGNYTNPNSSNNLASHQTRYPLPYYDVQADRYHHQQQQQQQQHHNLQPSADINWQQHPSFNPAASRHIPLNPYQHKDMHTNNGGGGGMYHPVMSSTMQPNATSLMHGGYHNPPHHPMQHPAFRMTPQDLTGAGGYSRENAAPLQLPHHHQSYYDGSSDFVMGGAGGMMAQNSQQQQQLNHLQPQAMPNSNMWEQQNMCRPQPQQSFQNVTSGGTEALMTAARHGVEGEMQESWKEW